ncbi:UNVERIFIED_CONTAM: hypothetical protein K2H54_048028 [Gekko kuhli]
METKCLTSVGVSTTVVKLAVNLILFGEFLFTFSYVRSASINKKPAIQILTDIKPPYIFTLVFSRFLLKCFSAEKVYSMPVGKVISKICKAKVQDKFKLNCVVF